VYGGEKVKDQDVDVAHVKIQEADSKGGMLHIENNCLFVILRYEKARGLLVRKTFQHVAHGPPNRGFPALRGLWGQ